MTRIAINGMGRIGRAVLKLLLDTEELKPVAINDIISPDNMLYLLRYDTVYGRYNREMKLDGDVLYMGKHEVRIINQKDPLQLPWRELNVDLVFECTGFFTGKEDLMKHIQAGAGMVILSAESKSDEIGTVVVGVNEPQRGTPIISCASCTTNCVTPVMEVMGRRIGISKAILTAIHAYTSTQKIVDAPSKKFRRGRAGAANLVPTTTGATSAAIKALPSLNGKFSGLAVRAPVAAGSISDMTILVSRPTTVDEVRKIFTEEAASDRYRGILGVTSDPIVSSDIIQDTHSSLVDLDLIQVVDGDLVKIMSWYDNEWGYAAQMVREAVRIALSR